ncbi:MAG TPA: bifunctional glutamate N-acetyltransferase/amino-acid acetyltransferase ArgJ [Armatimonadota bacterium]|nr:bifunctional glutamate N-acetyltransferase/amino-acid acetyltransferase ArgJ [Armatimonadota bacterium]
MAGESSNLHLKPIDGAVTAPKGFKAAGIRCGVKEKGPDLALICSDVPAACAALFTTNAVKAAPVIVSMERAKIGKAQAIVANAGNANACTGERGIADAVRMAEITASELGIDPDDVLVCSTGIIGHFLDMEKIKNGIHEAARDISVNDGPDAARAIMTTDTRPKMVSYEFELGGVPVRIGGIAKGAGMICPNVATMFCFITTDVAIEPGLLKECLVLSAEGSFNSLTIDGDTSTNDTVIILANGMAENKPIDTEGDDLEVFQEALDRVTEELAREIARDGEGATKLVEVVVKGAESYKDAKNAALTIANSPLVKTAVFGQDPNWGRVLAAAGRSGANLDLNKVDLFFGDVKLVQDGAAQNVASAAARKPMLSDELVITVDLKLGDASARVFTCDFSYDYIKINAEYHT